MHRELRRAPGGVRLLAAGLATSAHSALPLAGAVAIPNTALRRLLSARSGTVQRHPDDNDVLGKGGDVVIARIEMLLGKLESGEIKRDGPDWECYALRLRDLMDAAQAPIVAERQTHVGEQSSPPGSPDGTKNAAPLKADLRMKLTFLKLRYQKLGLDSRLMASLRADASPRQSPGRTPPRSPPDSPPVPRDRVMLTRANPAPAGTVQRTRWVWDDPPGGWRATTTRDTPYPAIRGHTNGAVLVDSPAVRTFAESVTLANGTVVDFPALIRVMDGVVLGVPVASKVWRSMRQALSEAITLPNKSHPAHGSNFDENQRPEVQIKDWANVISGELKLALEAFFRDRYNIHL